MNPQEEVIVSKFIAQNRCDRWRLLLNDPKRRGDIINLLAHVRDLDPACATWMKRRSTTDIIALLKAEGSAASVYVMSMDSKLDGQTMPLAEAVEAVFETSWGAILLCVPDGSLGYHYGEEGMTRALLKRPKTKK